MTKRLVIRDRQHLHELLDMVRHEPAIQAQVLIARMLIADFSGLYEGGTELPKEEARLFTTADVNLLQWIIDDERHLHHGDLSELHVACVQSLRDRISRSLIDSSVSPPHKEEAPK